MCPALRGSTVSYAGDAHFPKHSLEYSLNLWSQSKKKKNDWMVSKICQTMSCEMALANGGGNPICLSCTHFYTVGL